MQRLNLFLQKSPIPSGMRNLGFGARQKYTLTHHLQGTQSVGKSFFWGTLVTNSGLQKVKGIATSVS
jgi:hypothetical protein